MESLQDIFKRIELAQQDIANITAKIKEKGGKLDDYDIKNILFVSRELHENAVLLSHFKSIEKNIIDVYSASKITNDKVLDETPKTNNTIVDQVVEQPKVQETTQKPFVEIEKNEPVFVEIKEEIKISDENPKEELISTINESSMNIEEIAQNLESEISQTIQSFSAQNTIPNTYNKSIFEKIADEKSVDNSLASKLSKTKIKDLVNSIGLNEKFLFINELFGGNSSLYNQEIQVLNTQNNGNDAMKYFHELQQKFNWEKEGKEYEKFKDLIERRYL
jgi:hypothetical protein